ncbi:MAG: RidA family protein [Planctomycetales bacterium]|nr:RidA family protein [Planctomycetales bacterium]
MSVEARVAELGLQLPEMPAALGLYRPVLVVGDLAYLSGHGPLQPDGTFVKGKAGADLDVAAAKEAARLTALASLASLRVALGSLDRVGRLVKTMGLVNSAADFVDHPAVINGFSEVMRDVLGEEAGIGARSAFGVAALPAGWAVEIESVFQLAG